MGHTLSRRTRCSRSRPPRSLPSCWFAASADETASFPPCRTITRGPHHHWFGYYDKLEFDPSGRYVLSHEVDFEHRTPRPDDLIRIGMVDTHESDRWVPLGTTSAWGWQQGADAPVAPQVRVGSAVERPRGRSLRLSPARHPDRCVTNASTGHLHVELRRAVGAGGRLRPHPENATRYGTSAWLIAALQNGSRKRGRLETNLESGKRTCFFPCRRRQDSHLGKSLADHWNYFNHLLISPDASRFIGVFTAGEHPPAAASTASRPAASRRGCSPRQWTAPSVISSTPPATRRISCVIRSTSAPGRTPGREGGFLSPLRECRIQHRRRRRDEPQRAQHVSAAHRRTVDSLRHVSGRKEAHSDALSVSHVPTGRRIDLAAPPCAATVCLRVAVPPPPACQPRRADRRDRFAAYRRRSPDSPHRSPRTAYRVARRSGYHPRGANAPFEIRLMISEVIQPP